MPRTVSVPKEQDRKLPLGHTDINAYCAASSRSAEAGDLEVLLPRCSYPFFDSVLQRPLFRIHRTRHVSLQSVALPGIRQFRRGHR
jgi:hypothetical protein